MKYLLLVSCVSVTAIFFSSSVFAGEKWTMPRKGGEHLAMLELMDADNDGTVSDQEFRNFGDNVFMSADKNSDGSLDDQEFVTFSNIMEEKHMAAMEKVKQSRLKKHFEKLDTDKNGKISRAEFDAKQDMKFNHMDHNEDGHLTKEDHKKMMDKKKKMHEMKKNSDKP
ncbi:MAG: EF-hand domain-containing protein [Emcibacter sp.]|nr:EF-hand domain-containing protein [Emcibacter sp.]